RGSGPAARRGGPGGDGALGSAAAQGGARERPDSRGVGRAGRARPPATRGGRGRGAAGRDCETADRSAVRLTWWPRSEARPVVIVSLAAWQAAKASRLVGSYLTETDPPRGAALAVLNATNRLLGNFFATR